MPKPVEKSTTYLAGLDGLRGLAVLVVLGYHLHLPYFGGGLLGVGMFFTLSGFLITRILLTSWDRTGTLELKRFWVHRSRRLVPAVVLLLLTVLTWTFVAQRDALAQRWAESWTAMLYVANWHTIFKGQSYFDRFAGPGPLDHLWSLSVEEQFYVVWPVVLLVALGVLRMRRPALLIFTATLAAISFVLLAVLAVPGFDNTRAYEGTDTRAGGLLIGAMLAIAWPRITLAVSRGRWLGSFLQVAGVAGAGAIAWLIATTNDYSLSLYSRDLLLLSIATVALVAGVSLPGGALDRILGFEPLRWMGERSYGIYLWQMPLVAVVPTGSLAADPLIWSSAIFVATLLISELSWRLVEDPIRRHGFVGAGQATMRRLVSAGSGYRVIAVRTMPIGLATVCLGAIAIMTVCQQVAVQRPVAAPYASASGMNDSIGTTGSTAEGTSGSKVGQSPFDDPAPVAGIPGHSSCTSLAYIGESTSLGLMDPAQLPRRADRLPAQLRKRGVDQLNTDIAGARSIVERWQGQPNAQEAVQKQLDNGYSGCWAIAMGTNDSANLAVGGVGSAAERIDKVMSMIDPNDPVLWLTVKSLNHSGPYDDANMQAFDKALLDATKRYPNLRLYDWRAEVQDAWYISDGIHFTTPGYAQRSRRIAAALAQAFPSTGVASPEPVVSSGLR